MPAPPPPAPPPAQVREGGTAPAGASGSTKALGGEGVIDDNLLGISIYKKQAEGNDAAIVQEAIAFLAANPTGVAA